MKTLFILEDYDPVSIIAKDNNFLSNRKVKLVNQVILGKKPLSCLNFNYKKFQMKLFEKDFLETCFCPDFEYSTNGLKNLLNKWAESGGGLPWKDIPNEVIKHLTVKNFFKQYIGFFEGKKFIPQFCNKERYKLIKHYQKYNEINLSFEEIYQQFEDILYFYVEGGSLGSVKGESFYSTFVLLIISELCEVAKLLEKEPKVLFSEKIPQTVSFGIGNVRFACISETAFNEAVINLERAYNFPEVEISKVVNNFKGLFEDWYELPKLPHYYKYVKS